MPTNRAHKIATEILLLAGESEIALTSDLRVIIDKSMAANAKQRGTASAARIPLVRSAHSAWVPRKI